MRRQLFGLLVLLGGVMLPGVVVRAQEQGGDNENMRAQFAGMQRVSGEVTAVAGSTLTIKGADGTVYQVVTTDNTRVMKAHGVTEKIADVKMEGHKALICMVGEDIRGRSGMSGRVFSAIKHVNVRMISQGASEINMSFMIEESDVEEAVKSLHAHFFRDPDPEIFDVEARAAAV